MRTTKACVCFVLCTWVSIGGESYAQSAGSGTLSGNEHPIESNGPTELKPLNYEVLVPEKPAIHALDLAIKPPVPSVPLQTVTVYGQRDYLTKSDQRLQTLIASQPCLGCGGWMKAKTSIGEKAFDFGESAAIYALRNTIFQQPHVRHDSNDEALYFSQKGLCTAEDLLGCLKSSHPY